MNTITEIPEGYRIDAKGRLIPVDQIKAIDIERSDLVERLIGGAKLLQQQMLAFKKLAFEDIAAFIQLSAEQHGVQLGGNKGNVTLFSFDGKYKIVRQSQESIRFDESLQAAKALIDECISEWAESSNNNIRVLINDAFQVDKEGKISTGRVLSLRRLDKRLSEQLGGANIEVPMGTPITIAMRNKAVRDYALKEKSKPKLARHFGITLRSIRTILNNEVKPKSNEDRNYDLFAN